MKFQLNAFQWYAKTITVFGKVIAKKNKTKQKRQNLNDEQE